MTPKIASTTLTLGNKAIYLETGKFGVQTAASVTARCGDTLVLASVVTGNPREGLDFFPLTVEYREKHYAGGIISSSRFVKRESRPSDNEILTSRLIDRSIRPFFPKGFRNEVQVIVHPLSIDGINEPEVLGILAAATALSLSPVPFNGPVAALRVGFKDGQLLINPTTSEKLTSSLDLVISGTDSSIAMVEAGANEISEGDALAALDFGQKQLGIIIKDLSSFLKEASQEKKAFTSPEPDSELLALVDQTLNIDDILQQSKTQSGEGIKLSPIVDTLVGDNEALDRIAIAQIIDDKLKDRIRQLALQESIRFDDRKLDQIRPIAVEVGLLPRTHGSAFFQRGLTHALSVATLGSPEDAQLIEGMKGEETRRYIHHYNMTPIATGEPGRFGFPGRREIGHGALAERALLPVLPAKEDFPYTIRVVSEIMSSNGSTSQASVCGSTLALMDAGVPIKKPVAGIAMGLVSDGNNYVTLSDIAGLEDHYGDMDFKVAGTADGITALQMDVKIEGVTAQILKAALEQARIGRLHILGKMTAVLDKPRSEISQYAPRIEFLSIPVDKIGTVIGPGGKNIREIQTRFTVDVAIEDDGSVAITGVNPDTVKQAKDYIQVLTAEAEVGKTYTGKVTRLMDFGAFVEIIPGQEGLVHVSNMGQGFVKHPSEVVKEGDTVQVKVYEVDRQGRINLTMKLDGTPPQSSRPSGGSRPTTGRPPRRDFSEGGHPRSGDRGSSRPPFRGDRRPPNPSFTKFQDFR